MRPRHVLGPLALFTSSCAMPRPPSADFLARAEQVPPPHQLLLPSASGAFAAWQLPAEDPWARYSKGTLLASLGEQVQSGQLPDVRGLALVRRAERAAAQIAAPGLPADVLWVVDLRGAASVAFGNALSHLAPHPVSLVLTFNNWPAAQELIPAEETLAALVTLRPRLPDAASLASGASGARPVFLLDAWRLAYRDQAAAEDRTDNRYYLTEADLPDAATLQARGIRQVIYVTETLGDDPSLAVEEDDLHDAFLRYGQAGVALTLVGLDELAGERALAAPVQSSVVVLSAPWWHRRYLPRPRAMVHHSSAFYARSHGGFGGPRARPSFRAGFSHGSHGSHSGGHGGGG